LSISQLSNDLGDIILIGGLAANAATELCTSETLEVACSQMVARIHAIDNGIPQRSAALDDRPTHEWDVIVRQRACQRNETVKPYRTLCLALRCSGGVQTSLETVARPYGRELSLD
jgi:hypothetical protein